MWQVSYKKPGGQSGREFEKQPMLSSKTYTRIIGFQTYQEVFCLNVSMAKRILVCQCHGFFAGFVVCGGGRFCFWIRCEKLEEVPTLEVFLINASVENLSQNACQSKKLCEKQRNKKRWAAKFQYQTISVSKVNWLGEPLIVVCNLLLKPS